MVSVSNVFAGNRMVNVAGSEPVDTVAPADTTATPVETPAEAPTDTTVTPTDAPAETPAEAPATTVDSTIAE
ncbi:hypothetical protein DWV76_11630 [Segatella copri]|uniref:Uncharacterized protein n=2 Tax=Segatella copri TaxID=165179 RepID=A0AA92TWQ1_9BACT|nr:hypothetical protein DWV76_11630 [Segatella copri]